MKKLLLSIAWLSCAMLASAQANQTFILSNPQPIGQNLETNTPIQGMSYVFESPINQISVDPTDNTALILLQHSSKYFNKGVLLDYNLNTNKLKWEKQVNLNKEKVGLFPGQAILETNKSSIALNPLDSTASWQSGTSIFYADNELKIGIGFPGKSFTVSSNLSGINMTDGKEIWKRKVVHHFGINSITPIGNSTILIVADKLYAIDLKTGNGWEYELTTGSTSYPETAKTQVASKYIEDVNYNTLQDGRTVCGIVSAPLVKDGKIYIASEGKVSCLSMEGKVIWTAPTPEKLASRSRIFSENGKLYVVNTGYVYFDNKKIQYGEIFVAAFDLQTGQQEYLTKLDKGFVADFQAIDGRLFLLPPYKLVEMNLSTGEVVRKENFELPGRIEIVAFSHENFYLEDGNKFNKLTSTKDQLYLVSNQNKLIEFKPADKTSNIVAPEKLYREMFVAKDLTFIGQNKNSAVLDAQNKTIATLQIGIDSFIIGDYIYNMVDNILYRVDINTLTNK